MDPKAAGESPDQSKLAWYNTQDAPEMQLSQEELNQRAAEAARPSNTGIAASKKSSSWGSKFMSVFNRSSSESQAAKAGVPVERSISGSELRPSWKKKIGNTIAGLFRRSSFKGSSMASRPSNDTSGSTSMTDASTLHRGFATKSLLSQDNNPELQEVETFKENLSTKNPDVKLIMSTELGCKELDEYAKKTHQTENFGFLKDIQEYRSSVENYNKIKDNDKFPDKLKKQLLSDIKLKYEKIANNIKNEVVNLPSNIKSQFESTQFSEQTMTTIFDAAEDNILRLVQVNLSNTHKSEFNDLKTKWGVDVAPETPKAKEAAKATPGGEQTQKDKALTKEYVTKLSNKEFAGNLLPFIKTETGKQAFENFLNQKIRGIEITNRVGQAENVGYLKEMEEFNALVNFLSLIRKQGFKAGDWKYNELLNKIKEKYAKIANKYMKAGSENQLNIDLKFLSSFEKLVGSDDVEAMQAQFAIINSEVESLLGDVFYNSESFKKLK